MTRRRFFPATPVQTVPGRAVELEMHLRPEPVQTPAADAPPDSGGNEPDVIGAGWLMSLAGGDSGMGQMEDGRWYIYGHTNSMYRRSVWEGEPDVHEDEVVGIDGPDFRCVEMWMDQPRYSAAALVGVLQGRNLPDAHWEIEWDRPDGSDPSKSQAGHWARTAGNMVWVQFQPVDYEDESVRTENLFATAYCGSQQVAALLLTLEYSGA